MVSSPHMYNDGLLNIFTFGGILGLYYFPFSRLPLRLDGGIGVYSANDGEEKSPAGLWFKFGGETGFRFTPNFTLTVGAGWRQFQGNGRPLNSGIYAGLGMRFTFEAGERSSGGADGQYSRIQPQQPRARGQCRPCGLCFSLVPRNPSILKIRGGPCADKPPAGPQQQHGNGHLDF